MWTEKVVIAWFKEFELPAVKAKYEKDGIIDGPARREAFNNFTDFLCKDGIITEELYNEICLPKELDN
jgi:hypothetical protein